MEYYMGLDMGTSSVGWAVTDEKYNLIKKHGKDMWGIREFEEADTAEARRTFRAARRRRQREVARIGLLKDYFHDDLAKVDPNFFQRLENSKYFQEDKDEEVNEKYGIFADKNYTDKDYFKEYPTIYHLRKELLHSQEPHDVRLIYLALLNMYKHRGHFLNASLGIDGENRKMKDIYCDFVLMARDVLELEFPTEFGEVQFQNLMCARDLSRKKKAEKLIDLLGIDKKQKQHIALLECILGLDKSVKTLYGKKLADDFDKSIKINFSDSGFDEKAEELADILGEERFDLILCMKELYDSATLNQIMGTHKYLSEARVQEYEKHKNDLKKLKCVIKKYGTREQYAFLFRSVEKATYSAYVRSVNSGGKERRNMSERTKDALYATLKKILKEFPADDKDCIYIMEEIEKNHFLPKQMTSANGVIPNQIHAKEMKQILKNAEKYLSFLSEKDESGLSVSERILQLFTFQIPYYIGPLSTNSEKNNGNGWVIRKEEGKVFPWNMDQKIDKKKTSEEFISRMVRRCTYMGGEQVLPKSSLEYECFSVLNELNNLKVRNEKLPVEIKQKIYTDLFTRGKKVSKKSIANYLKGCGILQEGAEDELTGMMDSINSSLSSYGKFRAIFGDQMKEDSCKKMIEKIIFWCTVYGNSKQFLKEQMEENYGSILTQNQIKRILGFKLKDWGNLSKEFLELQGSRKDTGEKMSLIRMLWETNDNLMELLDNSQYTYKKELEKRQENLEKTLKEIQPEDLEGYYFSAPVKRMIWQTLLVLKETEKVMGQPPKRLFVEMTREHGEKNDIKDSRAKKFLDLYKNIREEDHDWKNVIENAEESGTIRSKKMYLYLTQRGRCMYTGNIIDLSQLFDNNLYDIDHIYPRHFVKDDNLENNMVLVEKQKNAHKSDKYPLEESIYNKQISFWRELHHQKLINDEKFKRLTDRNPFSDEQKAGFIARQLVETSQGTKGITKILKEVLPDTTMVYAKAKNVSDFRNQYKILKSRVVNEFHHAHDAYLNIVVGNVYYTKFTNNPINFIKKQEPYNLSRVFEWNVVRNGEEAWIAKPEKEQKITIETVRKMLARNTPLLTRLSFEGTGGLANQTLYGAEKAQGDGYIPLKSSDLKLRNVRKYGGFSSVSTAYFILVEHEQKKKRVRTLETVPILWKDRIEKDPKQLEVYCTEVLGLINSDIRIRKIRIQSLVKKDGYYMYLSGKTGNQIIMRNAVQLCLRQEWINYIKKLEKETIDEVITKEENSELYNLLCEKHLEGIYAKRPNPVGEKLRKRIYEFNQLEITEQRQLLLELLNLSKIGVVKANLTLIGETSSAGTMKVSKNISESKEFKLIHQSITGLYEKQVDLLNV